MGIIKEIDDLNPQKKGFFISVPILACFFSMIIIYLSPNFYFKFGFNVTVLFSLGLALFYYLAIIYYDYFLARFEIMLRKHQPYPEILEYTKGEKFHFRIFVSSFLPMYVAYTFIDTTKDGFKKYIGYLSMWVGVYFLLSLLGMLIFYYVDKRIKKRKQKKETKQVENNTEAEQTNNGG